MVSLARHIRNDRIGLPTWKDALSRARSAVPISGEPYELPSPLGLVAGLAAVGAAGADPLADPPAAADASRSRPSASSARPSSSGGRRYRLRDLLILLLRAAAVCLLGVGVRPAAGRGQAARRRRAGRRGPRRHPRPQPEHGGASDGVQAFERAGRPRRSTSPTRPGCSGEPDPRRRQPAAVFAGAVDQLRRHAGGAGRRQAARRGAEPQGGDRAAGEMLAARAAGGAQGAGHRQRLPAVQLGGRRLLAAAEGHADPARVGRAEGDAGRTWRSCASRRRAGSSRAARRGSRSTSATTPPTPRDVQVDVTVGGGVASARRPLPAGRKTTLAGDCVLPRAGWQGGEAKLAGGEDALAADDARPFVLDVRPAPTFALVTREPAKPAADVEPLPGAGAGPDPPARRAGRARAGRPARPGRARPRRRRRPPT